MYNSRWLRFLPLLQLPPAGPAAPCRAGCRATSAGACGCGLSEALLRTIRGHLQGTVSWSKLSWL